MPMDSDDSTTSRSPAVGAGPLVVDPATLEDLGARLRAVVTDLLAAVGDLDRLDGLCVGAAAVHDALGDLDTRWHGRARVLARVSDDLARRVEQARSAYDWAEADTARAMGGVDYPIAPP